MGRQASEDAHGATPVRRAEGRRDIGVRGDDAQGHLRLRAPHRRADPAALVHLRDIEAALREAVNLGIFTVNRAGRRPYSINEMSANLDVSKQAIFKRVQLGEDVHVRIEAARADGAVDFRTCDNGASLPAGAASWALGHHRGA